LHGGDRLFSRPEGCLGEVGMEVAHFSRLRDEGGVRRLGTEFFNDPKRERLSGWQSFIFSAMGIVGFVWLCSRSRCSE
jgi:hypothetical protein